MYCNKQAIEQIASLVDEPESGMSSHWRLEHRPASEHPLKDPWNFEYGDEGFRAIGPIGAISLKTGFAHTAVHWTLQTPYRRMGARFAHFREIDRAARAIARRQGRQYDRDLLRHALTLALMRSELPLESESDPIAVIGDGFANMASLVLACLPQSQVILANLTKTLLVDLVFAHKAFPDIGIALATTADEMCQAVAEPGLRIVALRADSADLMASVPIAAAVNIQSMMEMDPPITAHYFDVLRRSPRQTAFYCCNAVEKRLPDGTVTRFDAYPWRADDQVLVDGLCPWDQYSYNGRPPFYYRTRAIHHRLAILAGPPDRAPDPNGDG